MTESALEEARRKIKEALENGKPIPVGQDGSATQASGDTPVINVQPGKLATMIFQNI